MSLTEEVAELFCDAQAPLADKIRAYKRPWFSSLRVFVKREVDDYNRRVRVVTEELTRRQKRSVPSPPKPEAPAPAPPQARPQRLKYVVPLLNTHGTHGRCWHCERAFAREVLGQRLCEHHAKIRERNVAAIRSRRSDAA